MPKKVYSPLRYPGGKAKLYDKVSQIILQNQMNGCTYVEPFAGGAGLALALLYNNIVSNIVINDFDYRVYAFWQSILNDADLFCDKILNTPISIYEWRKQKHIYVNYNDFDILDIGFSLFFLNRTNRSGILKAGPIGGYEQNSNYKINCRFNKDKLIDNIQNVHKKRKHISVYNLDASHFISNNINRRKKQTFVNFDPPYYNKGPELYTNFYKNDDHILLSKSITGCNKPWIVTYDDCEFIKNLYSNYNHEVINLNYSAGNSKMGQEILFYSNQLNINF